ncbi:hypothetical protein M9Y10_026442 [Tritrichomonas musculus]|uniref:Uncharacterized protein n=1 Tax=Tritrichomonas musculus TaxID=1915356 RepID=A0ABR2H8M7_9EUKA
MELNQERRTRSLHNINDNDFDHKKNIENDYRNSKAWVVLTSKFGPNVNHDELLSLAEILSFHCKIPLSRENRRQKGKLIQWYNDNLNELWPFIKKNVEVKLSNGCSL